MNAEIVRREHSPADTTRYSGLPFSIAEVFVHTPDDYLFFVAEATKISLIYYIENTVESRSGVGGGSDSSRFLFLTSSSSGARGRCKRLVTRFVGYQSSSDFLLTSSVLLEQPPRCPSSDTF